MTAPPRHGISSLPAPLPERRVAPAASRYGLAVVATAAALALTVLLRAWVAPQVSLLFVGAVLVSAWYGGLGPGLLATGLAILALDLVFLPRRDTLWQFGLVDAIGLIEFTAIAVVMSSLSNSLRASRERAEAHAREVTRLATELERRAALRLEEKVREAEALARDLAVANEALQAKTREAEAANRAKSNFLAATSHDLKTPLNAIGGYTDLLLLEVRGPLTAEQRHDLERIQYSQRYLRRLIDSLLELSKMEAGQLDIELADVAVAEVVERACALVEPQRSERRLELAVELPDEPLVARADAERLLQVFVNLLSNAVKFTPEAGVVAVRVAREGARVVIRVADSGPGIPPEERERIFEPFVRLESRGAPEAEGTGLGLAIGRDLARAMGGTLRVVDAPEGGAEFVLTLRAAGAPEPAPEGPITLWPPVLFTPP